MTKINLITGFLGVGKTSAVLHLVQNKPTNEEWGIIVNEFGKVGIDQSVLEGHTPTVQISEIPGGCACCSANFAMQQELKAMMQNPPDRILIEPTGVGHPANILDMLKSDFWKDHLTVLSTVCLVNPNHFLDPKISQKPIFRDQIHLADILVANKTDLAGEEATQQFLEEGRKMFPPKIKVEHTTKGKIPAEWLDIPPEEKRAALFPEEHAHAHPEEQAPVPDPAPGRPVRQESDGNGQHTCGWIFSKEDRFNRNSLLEFFKALPENIRAKGAFRTGKNTVLINVADNNISEDIITYQRDSRVEIIGGEEKPDWEALEGALLECLK